MTAWPKQSNALESSYPANAVMQILEITGIVEHPRSEIRDWSARADGAPNARRPLCRRV